MHATKTTDGKETTTRSSILSAARVPGQAIIDAATSGIQQRGFEAGACVAIPRVIAAKPYSLRSALDQPGIAVMTAFAMASGLASLPNKGKAKLAYVQKRFGEWLTGHLGFQMDEVVTPESFYTRVLQFFGLTGYLPAIRLQFKAVYQGQSIGWTDQICLMDLLPAICTVTSGQKFTVVGFLDVLLGSYKLNVNIQQLTSALASGQKAIGSTDSASAIVDESVWAGFTQDKIDQLPLVIVVEPFKATQPEVSPVDGFAYVYHPGLNCFIRVAVVAKITPASWHVTYVHPKADGEEGFTLTILEQILNLPGFDPNILGLDNSVLATTLSVAQVLQIRIQMVEAIAKVQSNDTVLAELSVIKSQAKGSKSEAASVELDRIAMAGIEDVQTPVERSTLNTGLCAQALAAASQATMTGEYNTDAVGVESGLQLAGAV